MTECTRGLAHWHATAFPVEDGCDVIDPSWAESAPPCCGPCPWYHGQIVGPMIAAEVTGLSPEECLARSDRWQVVVAWHKEMCNG